jgi:hypothetical protein
MKLVLALAAGWAMLMVAGGCSQCVFGGAAASQPAVTGNRYDDPYYNYPGYPWDGPELGYVYAGDMIHPVEQRTNAGGY